MPKTALQAFPHFFRSLLSIPVLGYSVMTGWSFLLLMLVGLFCLAGTAPAQPMDGTHPTTEGSCSFGMAKGEASQSCLVSFPIGCLVVHIPGTNKPWTTISKGGKTSCRFDDRTTDWKSKITGSCDQCKSDHCSVQFIVRFDCSQQSH